MPKIIVPNLRLFERKATHIIYRSYRLKKFCASRFVFKTLNSINVKNKARSANSYVILILI